MLTTFTASGSVEDYDADAVASLEQNIADLITSGVSAEDVSVTVTPASVLVTATITVPEGATATAVRDELQSSLANASAASAALNITLESDPTFAIVEPSTGADGNADPTPSDGNTESIDEMPGAAQTATADDSVGMIAGIVGGVMGVAVLALCGGIWLRYRKDRQGSQAKLVAGESSSSLPDETEPSKLAAVAASTSATSIAVAIPPATSGTREAAQPCLSSAGSKPEAAVTGADPDSPRRRDHERPGTGGHRRASGEPGSPRRRSGEPGSHRRREGGEGEGEERRRRRSSKEEGGERRAANGERRRSSHRQRGPGSPGSPGSHASPDSPSSPNGGHRHRERSRSHTPAAPPDAGGA